LVVSTVVTDNTCDRTRQLHLYTMRTVTSAIPLYISYLLRASESRQET